MTNIHAELIKQYAEDWATTSEPWKLWECKKDICCEWKSLTTHPFWFSDMDYRRKPKTIKIGKYDIPEPCRISLQEETLFYVPAPSVPTLFVKYRWHNSAQCKELLEKGLVHLTEEVASLHTKALLSFTRED